MLAYIQRANAETKRQMQQIVADNNHDALIDNREGQYIPEYRLEKLRGGYVMAEYVRIIHPEIADAGWYTVGQRMDCASFTRCTLCGDIDVQWSDDDPQCLNCYDTGKVPEVDHLQRFYLEMAAARYAAQNKEMTR